MLTDSKLALKHRQNKSQRQRIIVFTCSPIAEDGKMLVKLAKKMKKGGVSVDIIAFGEPDDETVKKLRDFSEAVSGADGSFFEVIPPSPNLLSDTLLSTTLLQNEGVGGGLGAASGGAAAGGAAPADNQFEFGVNPELDPELALALRMSFEEEKARQEKERKAKEEDEAKTKLEGIPEGDEKQPLLNEEGEASGSKDDEEEADKKENPDKMDTA
jgi:26S proteasome regulatory subunit N10